MIETVDALNALVDKLGDTPVIGVDTEGDSLHHYRERVCLVQLSDSNTDYIIDPLKIEDMSRIGELTANPDQVLVLHGGDYDVVSLKRDFGCQFSNVFDTMIAGQFLGFPKIGLADLIKRFFGYHIDKKYQRHDWSSRPLEAEHQDYARGDTHWLLALREVLLLQLNRLDMGEAHREECDFLTLREWGSRGGSGANFLRVKRSKSLDDGQLRILRAVWDYRDERAQKMDRPAFKVIPGDVLLMLAQQAPVDLTALKKILRPGSSLVRRHGEGLVQAVNKGLEDTSELPEQEPRKRTINIQSRVGRAGGERIFLALKAWRNNTVKTKNVAPVVVASNDLLKMIARSAPLSVEELEEVPGIRRWQIKSFGPEIVDVVANLEVPPLHPKRKRRRRGGQSREPGEGSEPQGE